MGERGLDSGEGQQQRSDDDGQRQQRAQAEREPDALPVQRSGAGGLAGAEGLRDERIHREHQPDAEHSDADEQGVAQTDGTLRLGSEAADDGGVDDAEQRLTGLRECERPAELEDLADLVSERRGGRVRLRGGGDGFHLRGTDA